VSTNKATPANGPHYGALTLFTEQCVRHIWVVRPGSAATPFSIRSCWTRDGLIGRPRDRLRLKRNRTKRTCSELRELLRTSDTERCLMIKRIDQDEESPNQRGD